ncbi:hypothetical protein [Sphingomonas endophytica]|uniref:hypothetical protein n=1 Tax=Sphingomonas endophytica TaxID=869719 RepID=UPI001F4D0178|nr:hypothetical protein [Sphingomonas endophytica]
MTDMPMTMTASALSGGAAMPVLADARQFDWSTATAKQRGIYGFDSRDVRSRPFNMLRSRLLKLHRHKGRRWASRSSPPTSPRRCRGRRGSRRHWSTSTCGADRSRPISG